MDNVEILINQIYQKEPYSIVTIMEDGCPIGIFHKEDWESGDFEHVKVKCRNYVPPAFVQRAEIPIIGVVFEIDLCKCKELIVDEH